MPVVQSLRDREIEVLLKLREKFENPAEWNVSKKGNGNIWREWDGMALSIFRKYSGGYCWCVSNEERRSFSVTKYATVEEAKGALWDEVLWW